MTINEDNRQNFQDLLSQVLANKPGVVKTPNYSDSSMRESIGSALSMPKISSSKGTTKNPSVPSDIRSALNANKDYLPGGKKNDPGFFGTIADDINHPMKGVHALGRGFMNAVDIISRPGYAARSALLETVKSINAGEPFWSLGDDIGYGLKEGITGNRKTGFGDVVHEGEKWDPKTHKGGAWNSLYCF